MSFDVRASIQISIHHGWQRSYEAFCVCRNCNKSTVFIIAQTEHGLKDFLANNSPEALNESLNKYFDPMRFISLRDQSANAPPAHIPPDIASAFIEGSTSMAVECWNAAGSMFRLCIDLATKPLLPGGEVPGLNEKTRRDLGLRLPWLFENGRLPKDLQPLSKCVREDGNDAAHRGTLTKIDADDLLDFTTGLLERIYTEPAKITLAEKRRVERRKPKA